MKKMNSVQMESLQGGAKCWDFNVTLFGWEALVHDCDKKDRWHWFWEN